MNSMKKRGRRRRMMMMILIKKVMIMMIMRMEILMKMRMRIVNMTKNNFPKTLSSYFIHLKIVFSTLIRPLIMICRRS